MELLYILMTAVVLILCFVVQWVFARILFTLFYFHPYVKLVLYFIMLFLAERMTRVIMKQKWVTQIFR